MDDKKMNTCEGGMCAGGKCEGGKCMGCPMCQKMNSWGASHCGNHSPEYHVLRWVLGLFILFIIFCFGVKVGEIKGYMDATYRTQYQQMMMRYQGGAYGMMQNDYNQ